MYVDTHVLIHIIMSVIDRFRSMPIECFNRYEPLAQLDYSNDMSSDSKSSYSSSNNS